MIFKNIISHIIILSCAVHNLALANIISYSESFDIGRSTIQHYPAQNKTHVTELRRDRVYLNGFDSTLGNLTGVGISFNSNWELEVAISAHSFSGNEYNSSVVGWTDKTFEFYRLNGDTAVRGVSIPNFSTNTEQKNTAFITNCASGSVSCFAQSGIKSGEYNGNLNTSDFLLSDFYDSELEIFARQDKYLQGGTNTPPSDGTWTAFNQNNAWSGELEISYSYDPFAGTGDSIVELTDIPEVIFVSDETGSGALAAAIDSENQSGAGEITAAFTSIEESDVNLDDYVFNGFNFILPGDSLQLWDIGYSGSLLFGESVELIFGFDPMGLTTEEILALDIYHYENDKWVALGGIIDHINNTITVNTSSFSPFALGTSVGVSEPTTFVIFALGMIGIASRRFKKNIKNLSTYLHL